METPLYRQSEIEAFPGYRPSLTASPHFHDKVSVDIILLRP